MPRNGSGQYALPSGINPVVTQTLITSNWANTTLSDVASAITQSIARDGQTVPTANLPMGGFHHTGCGDPVLRNDYATLGYIQDGSHYQLINIAGTNAISAVLPGGLSSYSLGMIVQLQPVATSTGPVTLNINGIDTVQIVSGVGNQLGAGDMVLGKAYLLMFNGVAFELITGTDASTFAQAAMSGWDRPSPSGAYPPVTKVNQFTINVPGGTGRIIAPSTRDISGVTEVSWPTQDVVVTNLAQWSSIVAVNEFGTIVQFAGNALPSAARGNIILATLAHVSGEIDSIRTRPAIYGDMTYAAYDLASLFNNMLLSGGLITANAGNLLHMDLAAGVVWQIGGAPNETNGPNIVPFVAVPDFSFFPVTGASGHTAITQTAPVTSYDPGGLGVVTAIPGGATTASIHRIYVMAGTLVWLYGQNQYTDLATAIANIGVDTQTLKIPALLVNATLLSLVVAQKNCVALNNTATCRIVPQGGTSYSVGAAGSISEAPVDGFTYGRRNTVWVRAVDQVIAGDGITVDSTNPSKPVVAFGSSFGGGKTLTSGDFVFGATSNINYTGTNFFIRGTSVDGADNQTITISSAPILGGVRGAGISLAGNEAAVTPGQVTITAGTGAPLVLAGGPVTVTQDLNMTGGSTNFNYSNIDFRIQPVTADGADNARIVIQGGGATGATRGGMITVSGNESINNGLIQIASGGTANIDLVAQGDVRIVGSRIFGTAIHNNPAGNAGTTNQYISSGTYTPTLTNVANLTGSTPNVTQFIRVGNVVTVAGQISAQATAAANTLTQLRLSLPIASAIDVAPRLGGSGCILFSGTPASAPVAINADIANDTALFSWLSPTTTNSSLTFTFSYVVL